MEESIVVEGKGVLYGISNPTEQPDRTVTLYDGSVILACLRLDRAFPEQGCGMWGIQPGVELKIAFTKELRMVTDGVGVKVHKY